MQKGLKVYLVGGAVRDKLLGRAVNDRDWVVVGSTPEEMVARGFTPVGSDFPVFLHPETHEEYALARTERKVARGYKGFSVYATPEVTLEEDLRRRDFTINAMAEDEDGRLIDPYSGQADLEAGVLRHVSDAFAEDPVRVLRAARFAARYGFDVAPETNLLMQELATNGELDTLVPERVWQELARGLMSDTPSRLIKTLRDCGALVKILPEVDALFGVPQPVAHHPEVDSGIHTLMALDDAADHGYQLATRFAVLLHDLGKATTPREMLPRHIGHEDRSADLAAPLCDRLMVPSDCRDVALMTARFHQKCHSAADLRPTTLVDLLYRCDAFRRPERFVLFLQASASDARGRKGYENRAYPAKEYLQGVLAAAAGIRAGEVAAACNDKTQIADRVRQARISAVKQFISTRLANEEGEQA